MASLKTIKNNYHLLSMQERFGLYQKASLRHDESELGAIQAATPMKSWKVIDFYFLREEIYRIDTVNMLQRLGHHSMFELFIRLADDEKDEKKADSIIDSSCVSAYLYTVETDAWQMVCEELGFEVNWFRKLASQFSFAVEMMEKHDSFMRDIAFNKDEAEKHLKTQAVKRFKIKADFEITTLEEKTKFYRDFIESI